jgi:co-chaperonin GroES (HSP10)
MEKVNLAELRKRRIDSFVDSIPEELRFDESNPQSHAYKGLSLINLLPKNKSVLIYMMKEEEEEITPGGLIIPKLQQESMVNDRTDVSSYYGFIIAAAPDTVWYTDQVTEKSVPYRAGDICMYAKHRETYVRFGGKNLIMASEFDVWGIVPDNAYYNYVFDAKADVFKNLRYRLKSNQEILDRENPELK